MTHICVGKLTTIGSDNGLSPGRRQAIIWTIAGILLFRPLGTKFKWNLNRNSYVFIQENSFENVVCEMAAILSRPQCVKTLHYWVILFGPSRVAIHHIDLWRKKCHGWHLTDECFNNSTPPSHVRHRWLPRSRKCQESGTTVTPSGNNQRGVGRMSHLINGTTLDFLVRIFVHLKWN